jgi:hypothetical protein
MTTKCNMERMDQKKSPGTEKAISEKSGEIQNSS